MARPGGVYGEHEAQAGAVGSGAVGTGIGGVAVVVGQQQGALASREDGANKEG